MNDILPPDPSQDPRNADKGGSDLSAVFDVADVGFRVASAMWDAGVAVCETGATAVQCTVEIVGSCLDGL